MNRETSLVQAQQKNVAQQRWRVTINVRIYSLFTKNLYLFWLKLILSDVVTIDKTGEYFRLIYNVKGRFTIHRITAEEAKVNQF